MEEAIRLREAGLSIRSIELALGVSRSTLSGWLRGVKLTEAQEKALRTSWINGLVSARLAASYKNRKKKLERLDFAKERAFKIVDAIDLEETNVSKLALALLYSGEGFKVAEETSLGNSDTKIVTAFYRLLDKVYGIDKNRLRIYLHLRADQSPLTEMKYWGRILDLTPKYFKIAPVDKRTIGKKTFEGYHGVCAVRYYDVSIKRELVEIAKEYYRRITLEL